jgi:hypothetical protein
MKIAVAVLLCLLAAPTGVVLQSVEKLGGEWVGHLVNLSHKDVVTISITVSPGSELTVNSHESQPFAPGATKDVPLGSSADKPSPVVDVVIYADHTAQVGNEQAFAHILEMREEALLTLQKANEILAKGGGPKELEALAATIPVGSRGERIKTDDRPSVDPNSLRQMAEELRDGNITPAELSKRNEAFIAEHRTPITRVQP